MIYKQLSILKLHCTAANMSMTYLNSELAENYDYIIHFIVLTLLSLVACVNFYLCITVSVQQVKY